VCCCHTAILFSAFALSNLKKKRPFKGRFITLEKSNQVKGRLLLTEKFAIIALLTLRTKLAVLP
jgi:hypothetical protein